MLSGFRGGGDEHARACGHQVPQITVAGPQQHAAHSAPGVQEVSAGLQSHYRESPGAILNFCMGEVPPELHPRITCPTIRSTCQCVASFQI